MHPKDETTSNLHDFLNAILHGEVLPEGVVLPEMEKIDPKDLPFSDGCPDETSKCDNCEHFDECFADEIDIRQELAQLLWGIPDIERVIFSDPATIVFWEDGTKTVVKAMKGEKFERYAGFAAACMKKLFGSTSRAKAVMEEVAVEQVKTPKKKKTTAVPDMTEAFAVQQTLHNETIQEAIDEALG